MGKSAHGLPFDAVAVTCARTSFFSFRVVSVPCHMSVPVHWLSILSPKPPAAVRPAPALFPPMISPGLPCASPRCSISFFICAATSGGICGSCCPRLLWWECPCCGVALSTCASWTGADGPPNPTCGGICVAAGLKACRSCALEFATGPAPELGFILGDN